MSHAVETTQRIEVQTAAEETATEILLGPGVLSEAPTHLRRYAASRLMLIADENVAPLHGEQLRERLARSGFRASLLRVPAGEAAKSLETLTRLYAELHDAGVERDDVVVAVGGGMVGDVAGMLAATYLRGLTLVQVPTSLVAIITASVGGKVGVNFMEHKNLIGCFKQPALVLADTDTLRTLPPVEFSSGLGELLTVGVLGAPRIFLALEANGARDLGPLMAEAVRCKAAVCEADPYDRLGVRAKLNLGHTFGHAFETLSGFTLPHGLAVGVGLHVAARLAAELKMCAPELPSRIRRVLTSLGLPAELNGYAAAAVVEAMRHDKKRTGGRLRWVLPTTIGEVELVGEERVPAALLEEVLTEVVERGRER